MDGARTHYDQQTVILTVKDMLYRLALLVDLCTQRAIHHHALAQVRPAPLRPLPPPFRRTVRKVV